MDRELSQARNEQINTPPNIEEVVMQKVVDISETGIGYSIISAMSPGDLESVLCHGFLGEDQTVFGPKKSIITPERYLENLKNRDASVYINIVGRARINERNKSGMGLGLPDTRHEIARSYFMNRGNVAVLFSVDHLSELRPDFRLPVALRRAMRAQIFFTIGKHLDSNLPIEDHEMQRLLQQDRLQNQRDYDAKGRPLPTSSNGFIVSGRIAPRLFQGIVFCPSKDGTEEKIKAKIELYRQLYGEKASGAALDDLKRGKASSDPAVIEEHAADILRIMKLAYPDRPERLLPIYDTSGNLCWPRKMTFDEVKQFVASRR